jgi:predicted ATPase/class 3 adenylate cyclase
VLVCAHCGQENPDIARFCLACATPLGAEERVERRTLATFLFCDMTGSTAMGERLDPESVRDVMFRYFQRMRSVIERHGGTVDKYIGDAVVAVFGVPVVHEDDALRALRAAAEMQAQLSMLNEELHAEFGSRVAIRIGVNTGEVIAGGTTAQQTIVLGDPVNLAARLEQAAEPGDVLLGETTYRLARHLVSVTPVEPLTLKGKAKPVPAYRLVSISPQSRLHTRLAGLTLGRETDLATIMRLFDQVRVQSNCALATVVGHAGLGKSHLAARFVSEVAEDARVVRGHCLSYGEGITFWPIAEIVRDAAGIAVEDTPTRARERIEVLLVRSESSGLVADRVAQATGLTSGTAPAEEIAWAIRVLFEELAHDRPLVLVIEDIHWAEPALLDLLIRLSETSDAAIFILCLARPELLERRPGWPVTVELRPLEEAESAQLVEELLPDTPMPRELRDRVVAAASGNPLFIEELVHMLVEDGLVGDGTVPAAELGDLAMPETINALLSARLGRLPSAERGALERGSVEGSLFHRRALERLSTPEARPELLTQLDTLVQKEFITPARASFADEEAFEFLHALIRDAAYRATPKKLRADLHEGLAAWLSDVAGTRLREYEELLGYHLEQAYRLRAELGPVGDRERQIAARASEHLSASARRARIRGDVAAWINLLSRTLALVPDDGPRKSELLVELGVAWTGAGDLARAETLLTEAAEAAAAQGNAKVGASAALERSFVEFLRDTSGTAEAMLVAAERAVAVFEQLGEDLELARAWRKVAFAHLVNGRYGLCARGLQRAFGYAEDAGSEAEKTPIFNMLGMALWFGPVPVPIAAGHLQDALAEIEAQPVQEASLLAPLAGLRAMEGRFEEARLLLARARGILDELGLKSRLAETTLIAGAIETLAGDHRAAEAALRDGYAILDAMGEQAVRSTVAAFLAAALTMQQRDEDAEALLEVGDSTAAADDVVTQAKLKATRAKILARRGSTKEAVVLARSAVEVLHPTDALDEQACALRDLADVLTRAGDPAAARAALQEALDLYRAKENSVAAETTAATLDRARALDGG